MIRTRFALLHHLVIMTYATIVLEYLFKYSFTLTHQL